MLDQAAQISAEYGRTGWLIAETVIAHPALVLVQRLEQRRDGRGEVRNAHSADVAAGPRHPETSGQQLRRPDDLERVIGSAPTKPGDEPSGYRTVIS